MARVLSGIRPTGQLHLGNYLGAVKQFIELQKAENSCYYFIADLHALTTPHVHLNIRENTIDMIRGYLACGIDPDKAVIYRQSEIKEIPYLALLFGMITSESWLRKCTTFKEKASKQEAVSVGLLSYPVLMATDILIVDADIVPVGHDQLQHIEMTRDIAQKFNTTYGEVFVMPDALKLSAIRLPSLDGSGKMGKSEGNAIFLFEPEKEIRKKVMSAVTDQGPVFNQTMSTELKNIFFYIEQFSTEETYQKYLEMYNSGQQKFYGEMKKQLANDIISLLQPIQERYFQSSECSKEKAIDVLEQGEKTAQKTAQHRFQLAFEKFNL